MVVFTSISGVLVVFLDVLHDMRVAAIQLRTVIGDIDVNLAAGEKLDGVAAGEGDGWIILPELFTTGTTLITAGRDSERLANTSLDRSAQPLSQLFNVLKVVANRRARSTLT
jgi:predicted amidohydrolase